MRHSSPNLNIMPQKSIGLNIWNFGIKHSRSNARAYAGVDQVTASQ